MKFSLLGLAAAAVLGATLPAAAAPIHATEVSWADNGTVGGANNRNVKGNALGAPDGAFLSLGLTAKDPSKPGFAVFGFGQAFTGPGAVWEVTFGSRNGYLESADIFVGDTYDMGAAPSFAAVSAFSKIGSVDNQGPNVGTNGMLRSFTFSGSFRYLAFVDTSPSAANRDGFDIDAVSVTPAPVPVPAAMPLLVAGLGALGVAARRRKAA